MLTVTSEVKLHRIDSFTSIFKTKMTQKQLMKNQFRKSIDLDILRERHRKSSFKRLTYTYMYLVGNKYYQHELLQLRFIAPKRVGF